MQKRNMINSVAAFFTYLLFLLPTAGLSQTSGNYSLAGVWQGYATAGATQIDYQWNIQQLGSSVSGQISLKLQSHTTWTTYAFQGVLADNILNFSGTQWLSGANRGFCLATGVLNLQIVDNQPVLAGNWGPNVVFGGCPPGSGGAVWLRRVAPVAHS